MLQFQIHSVHIFLKENVATHRKSVVGKCQNSLEARQGSNSAQHKNVFTQISSTVNGALGGRVPP